MNLNYLKNFIKEKIAEYPFLEDDIKGFYYLCLQEIEDGGSEIQEVQSAISDIEDLIEEGPPDLREPDGTCYE
jgi:archaellum component FlaC